MKRKAILVAASIILLVCCGGAGQRVVQAQSDETIQKYELGVHFTSLSLDRGFDMQAEPGLGGRFTYNLTDNLAIEAEGNFLPRQTAFGYFRTGGRAVEGLFGVKLGRRYKRFGIFGKARPGFISFSQGRFELVPTTQTPDLFAPFTVRTERLTHFAADIGGVVEFYPSRRIFTRIDAGDTIIRYGQTGTDFLSVDANNQFVTTHTTIPAETRHNFQFSAGIGFRF